MRIRGISLRIEITFATTLFFLVWGGAVSGTKFKIEQIEVISKGKLRPTKILEDKNREQVETSQYGGWLNRNLGGTGFFRTQKDGGRWWLVDPEGYLFISMGLNSFKANNSARSVSIMQAKFGHKAGWLSHEMKNYKSVGLNTLGCWSDWKQVRQSDTPIPYTRRWNFMSTYAKKHVTQGRRQDYYAENGALFVFDPEFEQFCDEHAKQLVETREDPYLLGHFSDNELPFYKNKRYGGMLARFLELDKDDPRYIHTYQWLVTRKGTQNTGAITDQDETNFQQYVVATYYRIVSQAIKKYDPNHLFLGSRFHGGAKRSEAVVRGASRYVDVFSYNYYGAWTPSWKNMDLWVLHGKKPFLITEFYVKGGDTNMKNDEGAGWIVPTQVDRAAFYQHWAISLLSHPGAVGWHWHRYQDYDDPKHDSNKGVVNCNFEWYVPLEEAISNIGHQVYPLTLFLQRN